MLVRRPQLVVELVLLALVASLGALGVGTAVHLALEEPLPAPTATPAASPAATALAPLAEYAVIAERDIFNPPGTAGETGAPPSALRLSGVGFEGHEARAVIEDTATRRQELYRVGDRVGGARIAAIDWDRVTLVHSGGEAVLELVPPSEPPVPDEAPVSAAAGQDERIRRTSENAWVVDRRALAGAVDNVSGLLTQVRAVAEVHEGRPAGFRLFRIRADSLFAQLGLRDGDVVQRVNGQPVAEPTALLGFLARLRAEPRVALDIVRRDVPRTLVYDLR
jgi:general secretion pathway protein C